MKISQESLLISANKGLNEVFADVRKKIVQKQPLGELRITSVIDSAFMFVEQYYDEISRDEVVMECKDETYNEFMEQMKFLFRILSKSIASEEQYISALLEREEYIDPMNIEGINNGRVAQFEKFFMLHRYTQVIPHGKILKPVLDSFMRYIDYRATQDKKLSIDSLVLEKFNKFLLEAFDDLARFKDFATKYPHMLRDEHFLKAADIAIRKNRPEILELIGKIKRERDTARNSTKKVVK